MIVSDEPVSESVGRASRGRGQRKIGEYRENATPTPRDRSAHAGSVTAVADTRKGVLVTRQAR